MSLRPRVLMAVFNELDYDGRVQRAAEALAPIYDVTVLAIASEHPFATAGYTLRTVVLRRGRRAGLLGQLQFWLAFIVSVLRWRPAVVHAHDFFLAFPGWVAARVSGARLVYDAHELIIPEPGQRLPLRDALFYRLETWVVRRAALVIAANRPRAELMAQHYHLDRVPLPVENVPPTPHSVLADAEVAALYPALKPAPDGTTLVYQGDMSLERGVGVFLDALPLLDPSFRMVLIGAGPDLATLRDRAAAQADASRAIFLGRVPRAHLYDLMRRCDVGVVTYPTRGLNNVYCASNKVFEYLQAGLALVATCQPPLRDIIGTFNVGLLVGCDAQATPADVAGAVRSLAASLAEHRARAGDVLEVFSWENEQAKLLGAYAGAMESGRAGAPRR